MQAFVSDSHPLPNEPARYVDARLLALAVVMSTRGFGPTDQLPRGLRRFCIDLLQQHMRATTGRQPEVIAAAEQCLLDLGEYLVVLVGVEGYHALLERALRLGVGEFPALASVQARYRPPGRVVGLQRSARRLPPDDVQDALALTLANLIWLLSKLIGKDLSLHLLRDVWPRMSRADLDLET
jgi:hypothetical protein